MIDALGEEHLVVLELFLPSGDNPRITLFPLNLLLAKFRKLTGGWMEK
ncbi:hypothetical protein [Komagataeibacter intermedius]|nr:hypothetical protein [Komagataeibacter intermedius]